MTNIPEDSFPPGEGTPPQQQSHHGLSAYSERNTASGIQPVENQNIHAETIADEAQLTKDKNNNRSHFEENNDHSHFEENNNRSHFKYKHSY